MNLIITVNYINKMVYVIYFELFITLIVFIFSKCKLKSIYEEYP